MTRRIPQLLAVFLLSVSPWAGGCSDDSANLSLADDTSVLDSTDDGATGDASAHDVVTRDSDALGPVDTVAAKPFWMPDSGGFTVLFLDVGQGDAIVVISDDGTTMLVDGGRTENLLAQRLKSMQLTRLDVVVASHADLDHIGGLGAAFDAFDVGTVYWNGAKKETASFMEFLDDATKEGAKLIEPRRGESFKLGPLKVEVVHPGKLSGNHNDDSIVLQTGCAGSWVLLTGDAENAAEKEMLNEFGVSDIDVLKVGHHGSKSGTSQTFIDALKPKHAIISAGVTNAYGHPDAGVIARLKKAGAKVLETDIDDADDTVMMTATCKGPYSFSRPFW